MSNIDLGFQVYLLIRHIGTSFCKATSNVDHSSTASFCLSDAIHCCIQQPEQTCCADGATQFGFVCGWNTHGVQIFYEYLLILLKLVIWLGVNRSFQVGKIWSISSSSVIFKTLQVGAFSRHPYPSSARLPPSSPAVALASRDMRWNGWAVCKPFLLSFSSFAVFMLSYFSITPASEVLRLIPIPIPIPFLRNQTEGFPLCIYDIYVNGPLNSPQSGVAHCTHESFSNRKFG